MYFKYFKTGWRNILGYIRASPKKVPMRKFRPVQQNQPFILGKNFIHQKFTIFGHI